MLLAHWLYLLAATIGLLLPLQPANDGGIDKQDDDVSCTNTAAIRLEVSTRPPPSGSQLRTSHKSRCKSIELPTSRSTTRPSRCKGIELPTSWSEMRQAGGHVIGGDRTVGLRCGR